MWPKLKEKKSHDIRQCNHSTEMPVASRAAQLPVSDVITTNFSPLFLSPPVKTFHNELAFGSFINFLWLVSRYLIMVCFYDGKTEKKCVDIFYVPVS